MPFTFSRQLALGLGAFVVVVTSIATAWFALPHPLPNPARIVPAEQTIALFARMKKSDVPAFEKSFPILNVVPLSDTPSAVAILKTGTGQYGWAMLTPQTGADAPFAVQTSDAAAAALLQTVTNPLSADSTYSVLKPDTLDALSAYLRFPDMQIDPISPLSSLLKTDRPASLTASADGWQVRFIDTDSSRFPVLGSGPKDIFATPLFILHTSDGAHTLRLLSAGLKQEARPVVQAVLSQAVASLFGKDISATYDLPALLRGTVTLQTALDTEGSLRVVVEGQTGDSAPLIERLTTLFRAHLASVTQESQTFDEKFTMRTVRQDQSVIAEKTDAINSWSIRSIHQTKTGEALWIGTRGDHYILSNDETAFQKSVSQEAPVLSGFDQTPAGLGILDSRQLSAYLEENIPTVWRKNTLPSGTGGYLKWKMTQEGSRITLLLKKI